jgi:uncharacterized phage protein gp47/JayE
MPLIYVDDNGFHRASRDDLRAYLEATFKGIHGPNIDLSSEVLDGQLVDALADEWDSIFSLAEQVYRMRSPAAATGAGLARLVQINGIKKQDPAPSVGTVTLTGVPGSIVPAGSLVGNAQPGVAATFATVADATIGGGGTVDVAVQSTNTGPVPGDDGDLSVVLTLVPGWTSVTNAAPVLLGNAGETDAKLRTRRAASVALSSVGILDGLEGALLQVPGVLQARVRENPEDTTQTLIDGAALAPHAIQAMVIGGDPAAVAQTIWEKRSLGVTMVGGTTVAHVDSQGVSHNIKFDTLGGGINEAPIYVEIHTATPLSSDDQGAIAQAIAQRGGGTLTVNEVVLPGSQIGEGVSVSDVYDAITALKFSSLPSLKVGKIFIGLAAWPTVEDDIPLAYNEIAAWAPTVDPDVGAQIKFVSP